MEADSFVPEDAENFEIQDFVPNASTENVVSPETAIIVEAIKTESAEVQSAQTLMAVVEAAKQGGIPIESVLEGIFKVS